MCRRIILAGVVLAVLCAIIAVAVVILPFLAGKPVVDASNNFMQALKDGNYPSAFAMCDLSLQQELGTAEGMQGQIAGNNVSPSTWNLNSFNVQDNQGTVSGTVTFTDNKPGTVQITLQNIGGTWKIIGFNMQHDTLISLIYRSFFAHWFR